MKLVYNDYGTEVKVGDVVKLRDDEQARVVFFREPHKAGSSGKVSVKVFGSESSYDAEYFVGVIGAKWIEREDRA